MFYIIIPYFNLVGYDRFKTNLNKQLQHLNQSKDRNKFKIVITEGIYDNKYELEDFGKNVDFHFKYNLPHMIWAKENLINLAINNLPQDCTEICWLDRDIEFLNADWVTDSINELKYNDIIQPWEECLFLNELSNPQDMSFLPNKPEKFVSYCSFLQKNTNLRNVSFHFGHAWCITMSFYKKIGKLFELSPLGGADTIIALCLTPHIIPAYMLEIFGENYKNLIQSFKNARFSSINGKIIHNYHGSFINRGYRDRYTLYKNYNFNPDNHLCYNNRGVLMWNNCKNDWITEVEQYFLNRKEDI